MDGALTGGDFFLCMSDEAEWVLAANVSGVPWMFTGEVAKDRYTTKQRVTGFQNTLKQVVLGYFHPAQNTQIFLLVDADDAIHVCSAGGDDEHTIKSIPRSARRPPCRRISRVRARSIRPIPATRSLYSTQTEKRWRTQRWEAVRSLPVPDGI
jgi:hypothetical protein